MLLTIGLARPAASPAQEPVPSDTTGARLAADSLGREPAADSLAAAADRGADGQEERRIQAFPVRRADDPGTATLWTCGPTCLLDGPDLTLAELLARRTPGLVTVRGGYFGGPHHGLSGALGPGSLRVLLDGRELVPLESGQVDLTRISLVQLARVRVSRRAGEVVVDLSSHRQDTSVAYSRVAAGTGEPGVQVLRGIFSNGLGRDLVLEGWVDLLDVTELGRSNDRLEFHGRAGWMPGSNRFGLELEVGNQAVSRFAADSAEFDRQELWLRARWDASQVLQAELRAGRTAWRQDAPNGVGEEMPEPAEGDRTARELALALRAEAGGVEASAEVRVPDADWQPNVAGRAEAVWRPIPEVAVEGGASWASWSGFTTTEARGGLLLLPPLPAPLPLRVRVEAATGSRGIPRPLEGTADSVSFDALAAGLETEVGPYRLSGRASLQRSSRRLPFGDAFDRGLPPGPELEATGLEAAAEGPLLPLGLLVRGLEPIRFRGWWARHRPEEGEALYLPEEVLHGELHFEDRFFRGALEVRLAGHVTRRGATRAARAGEPESVALPAHTWTGGEFGFRVGRFRFWYKTLNPTGLAAMEVADVPFPARVNAFGVKWEFLN